MFTVAGYSVARLSLADVADVQRLYERCTDYHFAHEGTPTRANAGEEELTSLPPGRSADDKFSFGIYTADAVLIGYLELFRNYPDEGDWWVGLLMLDPDARGRGLGSEVFRAATIWAADRGARSILLAVLESDERAQRFWFRQGFELVRRREYQSHAEKKQHTVLIMRRAASMQKQARDPQGA